MKVGITAEALNRGGAGIGTYSYNLVEVVLKMLLKMDGTVFFSRAKNPDQIAEKVLELFGNEELRMEFSKNALKTSKKYDWDVLTERYSKILTGCTKI